MYFISLKQKQYKASLDNDLCILEILWGIFALVYTITNKEGMIFCKCQLNLSIHVLYQC